MVVGFAVVVVGFAVVVVGFTVVVVGFTVVVVGFAVVVVGFTVVVVGFTVVVVGPAVVVVGRAVVVGGGEAAACAGANIELIIGFVHRPGSIRAVTTPPIATFKTCRRSCLELFIVLASPSCNLRRTQGTVQSSL